jgi:cytochrome oxidase assembly protein ShyY1
VLRTALKPRWLGLLAIVATVMVTFAVLGLWQLNVARDKGRAEQVSTAPTRPIADLAAVLTPHGSFPDDGTGRRILATGHYDGSGQVLVTPRRLAGQGGYWVVTPFVVRSSGARIAVVRGSPCPEPWHRGSHPLPRARAPPLRCLKDRLPFSTCLSWSTAGPASCTTVSSLPPPSIPT